MKPTTHKSNTFDTSLIPQPKYKIDQDVYILLDGDIRGSYTIYKIKLNVELEFTGSHLRVDSENFVYYLTHNTLSTNDVYVDESEIFDSIESAKEALKKQLESQLKDIHKKVSNYDRTYEIYMREIETLEKKIESL